MAQNKNGSVGGWIIGGAALLALAGDAPAIIWIIIAGFAIHYVYKLNKKGEQAAPVSDRVKQPYIASPAGKERPELSIESITSDQRGYGIPPPPGKLLGPGTWVPVGTTVEIAGYSISGGMLYVGCKLDASFGGPDPALINPQKSVSKSGGDFTERLTGC